MAEYRTIYEPETVFKVSRFWAEIRRNPGYDVEIFDYNPRATTSGYQLVEFTTTLTKPDFDNLLLFPRLRDLYKFIKIAEVKDAN